MSDDGILTGVRYLLDLIWTAATEYWPVWVVPAIIGLIAWGIVVTVRHDTLVYAQACREAYAIARTSTDSIEAVKICHGLRIR